MSFSDDVAAEYEPPPSREEAMLACAAEWFQRVGITDPPKVELISTSLDFRDGDTGKVEYSQPAIVASWEYDGYRYQTDYTVGYPTMGQNFWVRIHTRHGQLDANTRADIGKAITVDRA
jgi:hypothetical protein